MPLVEIPTASVAAAVIPPPISESQFMFISPSCFLDEAQNASPLQLKTLITRISDDSKLVIEGDLSQCDKYRANGIPAYQKSGFYDVWKRLAGVKGVYQIEFTAEDCIRSGIVKRVLERYELEEEIYLGEGNKYELDFTFNPFAEDNSETIENEEIITN